MFVGREIDTESGGDTIGRLVEHLTVAAVACRLYLGLDLGMKLQDTLRHLALAGGPPYTLEG